jgi:hypothetical protein
VKKEGHRGAIPGSTVVTGCTTNVQVPSLHEFINTQVGKKEFNMPEYQPKAVSKDLVGPERHKFPKEKKNITEHNFLRLGAY